MCQDRAVTLVQTQSDIRHIQRFGDKSSSVQTYSGKSLPPEARALLPLPTLADGSRAGRGVVTRVVMRVLAIQRRETSCTASTSTETCSGGVCWLMPWPRLKM